MGALFITGSTGFIGSQFMTRIKDTGYESIYCLVRDPASAPAGVGKSQNCQVIHGSVTDASVYAPYLRSTSTVIHLAATTGKAPRQEYFTTNTRGTEVLIQECKKAGVKRFLYMSTISAKFSDTFGYHYAESKLLAEEVVKQSGLNFVIVRPTIVLGKEALIWKSLSRLAQLPIIPIFGSGTTPIQPVYIDDLINCLIDIVKDNLFANEIIEIGGSERITFEELLKKIHSLYSRKKATVFHIPLRPVVRLLSGIEGAFYRFLPVTAGQLAAFGNDGTIEANSVFLRHCSKMKSVDEILNILTNGERIGQR